MSTSDAIAAATGQGNRRSGNTINQIFKATYSNVPVYEYVCRGVAVMRRKNDAYVNATHILKVANFNKPQRTRILETEIQTGHHEKIQGGYGKYQGTWVPLERAAAVAKQFGVEEELRPLFEFVPSAESPPPAPKHITAATVRPKKPRGGSPAVKAVNGVMPAILPSNPGSGGGRKGSGSGKVTANVSNQVQQTGKQPHGSTSGPSSARRPSSGAVDAANIIHSLRPKRPSVSATEEVDGAVVVPARPKKSRKKQGESKKTVNVITPPATSRKRKPSAKKGKDSSGVHQANSFAPHGFLPSRAMYMDSEDDDYGEASPSDSDAARLLSTKDHGRVARVLFNYFTSEYTQIPQILLTPPPCIDVNLVIDDDGNTPLHWAAATARLKVVQHLASKFSVDLNRPNAAGQTALTRSIQFPDNHQDNAFGTLLDFLHPSLAALDRNGRSILHHISIAASYMTNPDHALYYMQHVIQRIQGAKFQLGWLLDAVDRRGDTALALARRLGVKGLPGMLLAAGAREVHNSVTDDSDFENDDDEFVSAPPYGSNYYDIDLSNGNPSNLGAGGGSYEGGGSQFNPSDFASPSSFAAQRKFLPIFENFTRRAREEFCKARDEHNSDLAEIGGHLSSANEEIVVNKRKLVDLQHDAEELPKKVQIVQDLETRLKRKLLSGQSRKILSCSAIKIEADRKDVNIGSSPEVSPATSTPTPASPPKAASEKRSEAQKLRDLIGNLENDRQNMSSTLASMKANYGQAAKYQKLISMCCGIPSAEVNEIVDTMAIDAE